MSGVEVLFLVVMAFLFGGALGSSMVERRYRKKKEEEVLGPHNRWDRKSYNDYQKLYMRRRRALEGTARAVAAGRAEWWPRRSDGQAG